MSDVSAAPTSPEDRDTQLDDCDAPLAGRHSEAGAGRTPLPAPAYLAPSIPASPPEGEMDDDASPLADLIRSARSVVALTGAGISVPSGIPDFRGRAGTRKGLWENLDPMAVAHIDAFRGDPARFWGFYAERFATLAGKLPNDAHRALVAMERAGLLDAVVTQNVDMLHRKAGTRELVEVHGSVATCSCLRCGGSVSLEQARALVAADGEGVPRCVPCGEPLKPDVVLFGELLSADALERAQRLCAGADVLLCVGSSLEVHPVGGLPLLTHERGGTVAIITQGPTPLDDIAAVRSHGDVEAELRTLAVELGVAQPDDG
jgi:NAD-dependent deacetylase